MKKIFAVIIIAATLLSLLGGCGADKELEPIEKAQAKAVEIGQQYLNYEITGAEAQALLNSIKVPETEGDGQQRLEIDIRLLASSIGMSAFTYEDVAHQVEAIAKYDYTD